MKKELNFTGNKFYCLTFYLFSLLFSLLREHFLLMPLLFGSVVVAAVVVQLNYIIVMIA